jgi:SAM-dependent methyltransferase
MDTDFTNRTPPLPPDELIDRVTTGVSADNAEHMRVGFLDSGKRSVRDIEALLSVVRKDFSDFESVLEFGCGCGRIMLWLQDVGERGQLHGTDIDADAIAWDTANMPYATFNVNDPEPPLPYADGQFDLVFNHSVLTHLDERLQDLWLAELHRITKPGGLLILTVHGEKVFEDAERDATGSGDNTDPWRAEMESRGILFVAEDSYVGSAFPDFYHTTFHAPWYVFEHWSQWFTVRAYVPRGDLEHQDIILLERPVDGQPIPKRPVRARPGGGAAAPGPAPAAPDAGPERPVDAVRAAIAAEEAPIGTSAHGPAGEFVRQGLFRALRPYLASRRRVDASLLRAIEDLDARSAMIRMPPLVKDVLDRQAERLSRVERGLANRIDDQERRLLALESERNNGDSPELKGPSGS